MTKIKNNLFYCFIFCSFFFLTYNICFARLSQNDRIAVKLEAYYALSKSHVNGTSENYKNGYYFGDWNYLADDKDAYEFVRNKLKGCSSNWTTHKYVNDDLRPPSRYGCCGNNCDYCNDVDFYTNVDEYGFANNTGRGGQCKYFAHLIYRRAVGEESIPTYNNMKSSSNSTRIEIQNTNVSVGDFIFIPDDDIRHAHCAIVVHVTKDANGNLENLQVVETNWNDPGDNRPHDCELNAGPSREAISTRTISKNTATGFKIWTNNCVHDNSCPKPPYNAIFTTLILDHSGSMKGQKMNRAKQAASSYVNDMKEGDCGSIIGFSTEAKTYELDTNKNKILCIGTVGQGKQSLKNTIGNISAGGSTNIAAGLENGRVQLSTSQSAKGAALLLSDGKHNIGPFGNVLNEAQKYKDNGWKIFTVAFGKDANLDNLCKIARMTDGACAPAEIENLVSVFQLMSSYGRDKTVLLDYDEYLRTGDIASYEIPVEQCAKTVTFYASWQGSSLDVLLTQPDGRTIGPEDLHAPLGRYEQGKTHLLMEVNKPQGGTWQVQVRWKVPPPVGEQVNLFVTEKTDVFANILPLENEYKLGQPVNIQVQANEVIGNKRVPLKNTTVQLTIKKPGPELIRMIQAQSQQFTMYKDVLHDITRNINMFDDGTHQDYASDDGIFGNIFRETDLNGAYLVTAVIKGQKQNGEFIEKTLRASFQVGPISKNPVTTSQVLNFLDQTKTTPKSRPSLPVDQGTPYNDESMSKPMQEIEGLQEDDPLDSIDKLLKGDN